LKSNRIQNQTGNGSRIYYEDGSEKGNGASDEIDESGIVIGSLKTKRNEGSWCLNWWRPKDRRYY